MIEALCPRRELHCRVEMIGLRTSEFPDNAQDREGRCVVFEMRANLCCDDIARLLRDGDSGLAGDGIEASMECGVGHSFAFFAAFGISLDSNSATSCGALR